ncbi:transmembrane protein 104 protein [Trichuris trichiura]|uniref:Transmembrane protein 104 protein n=1 Tax=Trichuris trichiura TaxID=36087 RepID=A0A077ZF06_TRITR|nr:transmembrane protein 104 protein [Trichuris trichiura]
MTDPVQYSALTGMTYLGNLLVGTGALALPRAFQDAGYILGIAVLTFISFMSFLNMTFVVEVLSAVGASVKMKRVHSLDASPINTPTHLEDDEEHCTIRKHIDISNDEEGQSSEALPEDFFDMTERIELGRAVNILLGYVGWLFFYTCMILYLFGDLAIYGAVVPKSLMNAICTYIPDSLDNQTSGFSPNLSDNLPCWKSESVDITRFNVYRVIVTMFGMVLGPFVFFGMTQTRYYQYVASFLRWLSFTIMVVWATCRAVMYWHISGLIPARIDQFTNLFGTSIYSFMCHHSLPGIITPMKTKRNIYHLVAVVYCLVLLFYLAISLTGVMAFRHVEDVYVLNFFQLEAKDPHLNIFGSIIRYFLVLYPVFTISSNYPIIGITLRRNIDTLFFSANPSKKEPTARYGLATEVDVTSSQELLVGSNGNEVVSFQQQSKMRHILRGVFLPLLVVTVPLSVAFFTDDVEVLISATGSYAGVGIQYIVPTWLAWKVRRSYKALYEAMPTHYVSPFRSTAWLALSFCWALFSICIVTVNHFMDS